MIGIVRAAIAARDMIPRGGQVAAGLSGGADSVCLLGVLLRLSEELDFTLRAIHINHGIRGESALRDEEHCRRLCDRLGIPLDVVRLDVPAIAARRGLGLEECGRECRYEQFALAARKYGCVIATAHTLSDSAETVLFNLARGSGLAGVCGIPPVRELSGTKVIRPLIGVTREQVEEYCAANGLEYVTDETNADTVYRRNLIRHQVIPSLREVNPAFSAAIARFTESAREDCAYLDSLAEDALHNAAREDGWDATTLSALPEPILRRVIAAIARTGNVTPEHTQVMLCRECLIKGSGAVTLTGSVRFAVTGGIVRLDTGSKPAADELWEVPLTLPETVLPDGRRLILRRVGRDDPLFTQKSQKTLFKNALNCGIIVGNISVRNRREGDRFAPAGRNVTKKLKKMLCDEGVPAEKRGRLAIISSPQGILWIEGFGCSQQAAPRPEDSEVLIPVIEE